MEEKKMGRKDDLLQLKRIILSELETLQENFEDMERQKETLEDRLSRCESELDDY
jgi:hypothetical protein